MPSKSAAVAIVFARAPGRIRASVTHGTLSCQRQGPRRLELTLRNISRRPRSPASVVSLRWKHGAFSFFVSDVSSACPILIPPYGVAVTSGRDGRDYSRLLADVQRSGRCSELQRLAEQPEEAFECAAAATVSQRVNTWLTVPRDMRVFMVRSVERWTLQILMRLYGKYLKVRGDDNYEVNLSFGRSISAESNLSRWLEDGSLPILNGQFSDGPVVYRFTLFATVERGPLASRGTHYAIAHRHGSASMMTAAQERELESLWAGEMDESHPAAVLALRVTATNGADHPRHAFFRAPQLRDDKLIVGADGLCRRDDSRVYAAVRLAGAAMPQPEASVLLRPREQVEYHMFLSHQFLDDQRARALAAMNWDVRFKECRSHWRQRLRQAASISVPERRVDQMIRAGLLHLDQVSFGREPNGPVAAAIGHYAPIGSESAPIIQFYDSMGWHDLARRAIDFFLVRQHDSGFIQNFGDYMLETGPTLWTIGEHWRYTRDVAWATRVAAKVRLACRFLLNWRKQNCRPDLRGRGYGLIQGRVADPADDYRQFMLNGMSVLGLHSAAEVLEASDAREAQRVRREAQRWKADLRQAIVEAFARSPVMPLDDGTWAPTLPPWAEQDGACWQHVQPVEAWTHGGFVIRDSLIGPLYLLFARIVDPHEQWGQWILQGHAVAATVRNAGPSQPYYCRHDWAHLMRGEVHAYLKMYYNQVAALADRETFTFHEHYYGEGSHKTHEEAWFLMQTRWMLWHEQGNTLRLLSMIPRAWMRQGPITLGHVASYFGRLSLCVTPDWSRRQVTATVKMDPSRAPRRVFLRLPHPDRAKATHCDGGRYDPMSESVEVAITAGEGNVKLAW